MKKIVFLLLLTLLAFVLRVYQISEVPASLSWDEASLGYNAYSISQTLRDEHGEFLPIARFVAFGDYKPPGYIYIDAVFVKILGLNEFSTRLPSVFAGTLIVWVVFFLTKEILYFFKVSKNKLRLGGLFSSFLLAISPWSIQFSRAAYEANLATLFSGMGLWLFLRGWRLNNWKSLFFSAVSFAASMYTFNTHRVFVPMLLVALAIIFIKQIWQAKKLFLLFTISFLLLVLPMVPHLMSAEGKLRFQEVAWVNDLAPIQQANKRILIDKNDWSGKIIHNRRMVYLFQFLEHYFDFYNPKFLFATGDVNPRLSVQSVGELYLIDLPFILFGIYFLVSKRSLGSLVILVWLVLAPIPGALARETPHALRVLNILPLPQIVMGMGVIQIYTVFKRKRNILFGLGVATIYCLSLVLYLADYYHFYRTFYASEWQYGYKQMINLVQKNEKRYEKISVTENYGRPYIYFLFYNSYSPQKYWATRKVERDWYGFWYVRSFDKYQFGNDILKSNNVLYVRGPHDGNQWGQKIGEVKNFDGSTVFNLFEK